MRSLKDTSGPAFIGSIEQAIPFFWGENGICPQLVDQMGGEDCFGEEAPSDNRWRVMLGSGCREGEELRSTGEARICCPYHVRRRFCGYCKCSLYAAGVAY